MPVALAVVVSPRLPGLLGPDAWRALGERPLAALPGAAATAEVLRAGGWPVSDVADLAAAQARPDAVVLLADGLDVSPVVTHRLPYLEFAGGMKEMAAGRAGKVVFSFGDSN